MAGKSKREIACELVDQGKDIKEIVRITGLKEKTIRRYRNNHINGKQNNIPLSMWVEWTERINRIRRAYGKEPFPIP